MNPINKLTAKVAACGLSAGILLGLSASAGGQSSDARPTTAIGLPAPALPPVEWRLGDPIKEWKSGEVYVLDFWATWCKPCIKSMPHMVEVQNKYKDKNVHVVGLAIWPNETSKPTKDWVEGRATDKIVENDNLNYAIADDIDNKVSDAFMKAMDRNGIPTVMIIDQKGRLAWAGHPMDGMDEALEQIVAGTYDLEKQATEAKAAREREGKAQALMMEFQSAQMSGDWAKVIEVTDKLIALDPEEFAQAGLYKYVLTLTKIGDKEKAAALGNEFVKNLFKDNSPLLNALAYLIVDHNEIKPEDRDLDLAMAAVTRANEIEEGKRPEVLDTLARVHFEKKNYPDAIATQEKALALITDDEGMTKDFTETLERYKKTAAGEE